MAPPTPTPANAQADAIEATLTDERADTRCNAFWRGVIAVLTLIGVGLTVAQVFYWSPFGRTLLGNEFLYLILAAFLPIVFLAFPMYTRAKPGVPWYDVVLAVAVAGVNLYFASNAQAILNEGWDYAGPSTAVYLSYLQWLLVLEVLRRAAGWIVTGIAFSFSVYPMFAGSIPLDVLRGIQFDLDGAATMHVMGVESILGLPLQTAASILVGFLMFGVVLRFTGGAEFFHDFAQSIFGTARGGSAKVSVVSSASFGMMSGSAVSNVLTTGPMTIPAMRKGGFSARYAAGVEATAASGGSVTPPIMGAAAFLMVSFVGVPYSEIAIAASIPALLYFVGIYTQIDAYAGRHRLRGIPRAQLPRLLPVVWRGWPFILALVALLVLLMVYRREAQAPFFVIAGLLVYGMLRPRDRMTPRDLPALLHSTGRTIAEIIGIIAGVGLIIGGLSMTGVSLSLARELVSAVGGSVALILIAGALTSFILGLGMTVSAVYVLLAIVMAPALVALGIDPIAAHLFVIYWATVSYITPPVGLAAFAAAAIAGTKPIPTSITAMRLGMVKYVIPFCFALNPALVAQSDLTDIVVSLVFALIGVFVMASSFEGYFIGVERKMNLLTRAIGVVSGFAILAPELSSSLIGLAVAAALAVFVRFTGAPPSEDDAIVDVSTEPGSDTDKEVR